jgi:hypothetical protein
METGFVIPGTEDKIKFRNIEEYLIFFKNVIVRNSGSKYEYEIAKLYCEFVLASADPLRIPLLLPEYRYEGQQTKHKYRLDFTIIEPIALSKYGFELSPWSTHGYLSNIAGLKQKEINELALDNFEKEMKKHKDFFRKHGVFGLIYTDSDLKNLDSIFEDMKAYLAPKAVGTQLRYHIFDEFFD